MVESEEEKNDKPDEGAITKQVWQANKLVSKDHVERDQEQDQEFNDEAGPEKGLEASGHVHGLKALIFLEILFQRILCVLCFVREFHGEALLSIFCDAPDAE